MSTYDVYIAQYSGNQHRRDDNNRHMEIFVVTHLDAKTNKQIGVGFHVTGDTTSWKFTVTDNLHCLNSAFCGRIHLGTIPASQAALKDLEDLLRTVPILHNDARFNCQRWAWSAGVLMLEKGYEVDFPNDFQVFLYNMRRAYDDWDNGCDSD
ncbi:hypothetical protein C8Q72DRAFT_891520 [Fomitopsis betulina]|nr:hypothetical protein C8Q72DRAFT_891520 [Fomitopsis betulina]